jgi:hypothetical protein
MQVLKYSIFINLKGCSRFYIVFLVFMFRGNENNFATFKECDLNCNSVLKLSTDLKKETKNIEEKKCMDFFNFIIINEKHNVLSYML